MEASDILDAPDDYDYRVFPDMMIGNDGSCMLVKNGWFDNRTDIALIAVEGNITLAGLTFLLSDIIMKKDGDIMPFQFYYNPDMEDQKADLYVFLSDSDSTKYKGDYSYKQTFYTAEQLSNMSDEELEEISRNMPYEHPSLEVLKTMDVGIYDENGNLIGEKPGGEY